MPSTSKGARFGRLFRFLVPLLSAAFALLAVEAGLRIFHPVPFVTEVNMYFIADAHTGYRLQPNSVGRFVDNIEAKSNSWGHRDDDASQAKRDGVFRILVLGDSFTAGVNVRQEEAYPQVVERLLKARLGDTVEVVNAGVGGWQPFQYAQYYEYYGAKFNPDLILIGFFVGNDTYDQMRSIEEASTAVAGRRVGRTEALSPFIGAKVWIYERSHTARLVMSTVAGQALPSGLTFRRKNCTDFTAQFLVTQTQRLQNHLPKDPGVETLANNAVSQVARIRAQAGMRAIPVVVAMIPDENQINGELRGRIVKEGTPDAYDFDMPQSMLVGMFRKTGIDEVIDLLPAFRRSGTCMYMNDTHWTPEGHALAAQVLAERLESHVRLRGAAGNPAKK